METSNRKPHWSARSKRTHAEAPTPSQMRRWNADIGGPSNHVHETPRGPRFGTVMKESPKTVRNRRLAIVDSMNKSAKLPGFYNSFLASTPVRPSQTRNGKVKKGEMGVVKDANWKGKERASPFGQPSQFSSTGPPPPSPPSSPTRMRPGADVEMHSDDAPPYDGDERNDEVDTGMGDVEMIEDDADDMLSEELDEVEPSNFNEEVCNDCLVPTLLLTITSLAASDNLDTFPALFHDFDFPDPDEGVIRNNACNIYRVVLQGLFSDPRYPRHDLELHRLGNHSPCSGRLSD